MKQTRIVGKNQEKIVKLCKSISSYDIQEQIREHCRTAVLGMVAELLEQEVEKLCGSPFSRKNSEYYYRGGSEDTTVLMEQGKVRLRRPRVRGPEGEVRLEVLEKLQDQDLLDGKIQKAMLKGVSTRKYGELFEEYAGKLSVSKSSISRAFQRASQKELDEINHGSLEGHEFVALILDGIEIADTMVVAAIGINSELEKIPLGLKEGNTENSEVVKDLLSSLEARGFQLYGEKILAVVDGSKALKKGLECVFGERLLLQRCWLHKVRNICAYLPKQYHLEVHQKMKRLMEIKEFRKAKIEYEQIHQWLKKLSHSAMESLEEAGENLLTLHALGVSGELRKSLSSTNIIESLFSVVRSTVQRVKRYPISSNQKLRWVAATILEHHRTKMRKLRGVQQKDILIAALSFKLERKAA
jgi:transposase-like protein